MSRDPSKERTQPIADPFGLSTDEIRHLMVPGTSCIPELEAVRGSLDALRRAPQTAIILAQTEPLLESLALVPQTTCTDYRLFIQTGDRKNYETPYFLKRAKLAAAALRLFLGRSDLKNVVQDSIWSICEETNWVLPAHERDIIDLFSAETAFMLADVLNLLGD